MKAEIRTVTIEVKRPFCPKCNTQIDTPKGKSSLIWAKYPKGEKFPHTHYQRECDCTIWGLLPNLDVKPQDRLVVVEAK